MNPGDDVVSGCIAMLRVRPELIAAFANPDDASSDPLISDDVPHREAMFDCEALVISAAGPYGSPSRGHTDDGVRLQAEIWADSGDMALYEPGRTRRRIEQVWLVLDEVLHRVEGDEQWWGTVRTIGSERLARVQSYEVPDSGGLWRGTAVYGVTIG